MGDPCGEANPRPGKSDLADIVQQTGLAYLGRKSRGNCLVIHRDQVALVMRVQVAKQKPDVLAGKQREIDGRRVAQRKGEPDLMQTVHDGIVGCRPEVRVGDHPRSRRTRSSSRLYPGPIKSL